MPQPVASWQRMRGKFRTVLRVYAASNSTWKGSTSNCARIPLTMSASATLYHTTRVPYPTMNVNLRDERKYHSGRLLLRRRRIVPVAGIHLERGAVAGDADLDLPVVGGGCRGVVDQGVLAARLLHGRAVGGFQRPRVELGEDLPAGGRGVFGQNIVGLARDVDLGQLAVDRDGGHVVLHAVDAHVVGQQHPQHVLVAGARAALKPIGEDKDHAAAGFFAAAEVQGGLKDRVIEDLGRNRLFGRSGIDAALRTLVKDAAVDGGPDRHGIIDRWSGDGALHGLQARQRLRGGVAQRRQEILVLLHRGAVGVDGDLVELAEGADQRAEGLLDLLQRDLRHRDIEDDGRRDGEGIAGEELDLLLHAVFVNGEILHDQAV